MFLICKIIQNTSQNNLEDVGGTARKRHASTVRKMTHDWTASSFTPASRLSSAVCCVDTESTLLSPHRAALMPRRAHTPAVQRPQHLPVASAARLHRVHGVFGNTSRGCRRNLGTRGSELRCLTSSGKNSTECDRRLSREDTE